MASVDIKVPVLPESVADATVATWHKKPGDPVKRDENLVDIETDKVVLEVVAPADGTLEKIIKDQGAVVKAQEVIATFSEGGAAAGPKSTEKTESKTEKKEEKQEKSEPKKTEPKSDKKDASKTPTSTEKPEGVEKIAATEEKPLSDNGNGKASPLSPSVRRLAAEQAIDTRTIKGSGKGGRIVKSDLLNASEKMPAPPMPSLISESRMRGGRSERRVPMSRLRARIAERLVEAQQTAAILTTFNEVNMQPVMELRQKYKEMFEKKYQVRLGFMSFFILAVIEAIKRFPAVNASIEGQDIIYHDFCDIGIAVSSPRGLVVPVLRNAETLSMPEIEATIAAFGQKAKDNQLTVEEMTGGTFTVSNGGVFGSLMSTPILNPPQSAILGMHKIEERPVIENGQIVIRPMMYLALSYDHRIIDGAESVRFLVTIKEQLEEPARLLMGI